jgi:hypothetical protein
MPCSEFEKKADAFSSTTYFNRLKRFASESRALLNGQNLNIPEYSVSQRQFTLNY